MTRPPTAQARAARRRFLDQNGLLWRELGARGTPNLCAGCLALIAPHSRAFCHSILTRRVWLCLDCGEMARDAGRPVPRLAPAESEAGHA